MGGDRQSSAGEVSTITLMALGVGSCSCRCRRNRSSQINPKSCDVDDVECIHAERLQSQLLDSGGHQSLALLESELRQDLASEL